MRRNYLQYFNDYICVMNMKGQELVWQLSKELLIDTEVKPGLTERLEKVHPSIFPYSKVMKVNSMELRTILYVDDSPLDVELTIEVLKDNNLINPVAVANDGVEALEYLRCEGQYRDRI